MSDPLVSIIIPVYNRPLEFERALKSAISQDYSNIEIVVVDDGSTEDIQSVIDHYLENQFSRQITYVRQENMGPGIARKTGLMQAKGKYIQYLDADDVILPSKIKIQVDALESDPSAVVCICTSKIPFSNDLLELALNSNPWPCSAPLWHYPSKESTVWPQLISGEDIVHFVSVGINSRKVIWINENYVQLFSSQLSLSNVSKNGEMWQKRLKDNFEYPFQMLQLLKGSNLLEKRKYSEPLAERFFRIGYQFAMIGEVNRSIKLFKAANEISNKSLKKIEAGLAIMLVKATHAKAPMLYRAIFKFHRLINPKSLHANKTITSLVRS